MEEVNETINHIKKLYDLVLGCPSLYQKTRDNLSNELKAIKKELDDLNERHRILKQKFGLTSETSNAVTEAAGTHDLVEYLAKMAKVYMDRIILSGSIANICLNLSDKMKDEEVQVEVPDVERMSFDQAIDILYKHEFQIDPLILGDAPTETLEYIVKEQSPRPYSKVKKGSRVSLKYYGKFNEERFLSQIDCSQFPGSVPAYDKFEQRAFCECPLGLDLDTEQTQCIDCHEYKAYFKRAIINDDLDSAEDLLYVAGNCLWFNEGYDLLRDIINQEEENRRIDEERTARDRRRRGSDRMSDSCRKLQTAIMYNSTLRNLEEAERLLAIATKNGCDIPQYVVRSFDRASHRDNQWKEMYDDYDRQRQIDEQHRRENLTIWNNNFARALDNLDQIYGDMRRPRWDWREDREWDLPPPLEPEPEPWKPEPKATPIDQPEYEGCFDGYEGVGKCWTNRSIKWDHQEEKWGGEQKRYSVPLKPASCPCTGKDQFKYWNKCKNQWGCYEIDRTPGASIRTP